LEYRKTRRHHTRRARVRKRERETVRERIGKDGVERERERDYNFTICPF
jgi:hypothetical protein